MAFLRPSFFLAMSMIAVVDLQSLACTSDC